jgi:hypothetical protein
MNENRIIWFFKEPRSGSSWLSHVLKHKLARADIHVDPELIGQVPIDQMGTELLSGRLGYTDTNAFYCTHRFELLAGLAVYQDPIIIRSVRRNIAEQVLSEMTADLSGWHLTHRYRDPSRNALSVNTYNNLIKNPVEVFKQDLIKYMRKVKRRDELWDMYSSKYENHTIVYEDLAQGVSLPVFEGTIKFGDYDDYIVKTPDYKRDLFVNYDQVVGWVNEYAKSMAISREGITSATDA